MLTYYITDRMQLAQDEAERRSLLLRKIGEATAAGVDFIQLREKDLCMRELESLAREALKIIHAEGPTRLLINHRTDVALAVGADGVHLTGSDISASDARALAAGQQFQSRRFLVAASCHSAEEVRLAESHGADFVVLAPIFEKANSAKNAIGLEELRHAAKKDQTPDQRVEAGDRGGNLPVFALGGVNLERAPLCAAAGATGIAGIRLFQDSRDLAGLVRALRAL
jgi:thiamine-phosphate pyrophosphorylase